MDLEHEFRVLTDRLWSIKYEMNALSSISLLPDEILSNIFFIFATEIGDPFDGHWTRVMLVCRKWRELCVAHAALWSYVSACRTFVPGLPVNERLRRSSKYTLSLQGHADNFHMANDVISLLTHARHRTVLLQLFTKSSTELEYIFSRVPELPVLEALKLEVRKSTTSRIAEKQEESFASRIRALSLTNIGFGTYHLLSNLTTLELVSREHIGDLPTVDVIFALLLRSPRLITLRLHDNWGNGEDFDDDNIPSVPLDYLQMLDVRDGSYYVELLFRALRMPPMVKLRLQLRDSSWGKEEFLSFMGLLRRHLRRPGGPMFRSLTLQRLSGHELSDALIRADIVDTCPPYVNSRGGDPIFREEDDVLLSVCTQYHWPNSDHTSTILTTLLHAIPFDLASVNVRAPPVPASPKIAEFGHSAWRTIGMVLPQLKSIEMGMGLGVKNMLRGLMEAMNHSAKVGITGRRRRRLAKRGVVRPTLLSLGTPGYSMGLEHRGWEGWFNDLVVALDRYRGCTCVDEPGGKLWDTLRFDETIAIGTEEYEEVLPRLHRLSQVVNTLIIGGKSYVTKVEHER